MNNMGREIMAALKRFQVGSDGDGVTVGGSLVVSGATTANTFSATNVTASGNLTFTGTGNRITGDFSNATLANRVAFQTSTANNTTVIQGIPNGTGSASRIELTNNSDPTNCALFYAGIAAGGGEATIQSRINGTGTYIPMSFFTGGSERMRIDTSGNVGIGTNSPQVSLQVNKASDPAVRIFETGSSVDTRLTSLTTAGIVGTYSNHPLAVYTNTTERMRINADGSTQFTNSSVGNSAYIRAGDSVTVASGATLTLTNDIAGAALICVYQTANGLGGVFFTNFSIAVAKISGDGEATDTGSTFALYKSSSSHTTTFKNKEGVSRGYRFGVYSALASL
jgi:hypothetical protein